MRLGLLLVASLITSGIASAEGLEFEAASVRGPVTPEVNLMRGGPGTSDPERISYTHVRLGTIIMRAFGLKFNELVGPDWLVGSSAAYDIQAKAPTGATEEQAKEMMRNLVKARFHLAYHFEKRSFDAYNLVVAKGGAKLKPAAPAVGPAAQGADADSPRAPAAKDRDGFPILPPGAPSFQGQGGADGHLRTTARALTMPMVVAFLEGSLRQEQVYYLIDKTGLTGRYDFKLDRSNRGPGVESPAPDFFTAVEQQLGLKFEKTKVMADVMVVDHVDKMPTEN